MQCTRIVLTPEAGKSSFWPLIRSYVFSGQRKDLRGLRECDCRNQHPVGRWPVLLPELVGWTAATVRPQLRGCPLGEARYLHRQATRTRRPAHRTTTRHPTPDGCCRRREN